MAYVAPRKNRVGVVTSYQVKRNLGGDRTNQQVECFARDEDGEGYMDPSVGVEESFIFPATRGR
ncbi:hypothetical protein ACVV2G_20530 [Streptomyces ziwulingensis]